MEGLRSQRRFTVTDIDPETGLVDRNRVMDALSAVEGMGNYFGGACIVAPIRQEVVITQDPETGRALRKEHRTIGWAFEFVKFMPAIDPPQTTASEAGEAAAIQQAENATAEQMDEARQALEDREPEPAPTG